MNNKLGVYDLAAISSNCLYDSQMYYAIPLPDLSADKKMQQFRSTGAFRNGTALAGFVYVVST